MNMNFLRRKPVPVKAEATFGDTGFRQAIACPPDRNYPVDFSEEQIKLCEEPYQYAQNTQSLDNKMRIIASIFQAQGGNLEDGLGGVVVPKILTDIVGYLNQSSGSSDIFSRVRSILNKDVIAKNFIVTMTPQQRNLFRVIFSLDDANELDYLLSRYPSFAGKVERMPGLYDALAKIVVLVPKDVKNRLIDELTNPATVPAKVGDANSDNFFASGVGQNRFGQYVDENTGEVLASQGGRRRRRRRLFSRKVQKKSKKIGRRKRRTRRT